MGCRGGVCVCDGYVGGGVKACPHQAMRFFRAKENGADRWIGAEMVWRPLVGVP